MAEAAAGPGVHGEDKGPATPTAEGAMERWVEEGQSGDGAVAAGEYCSFNPCLDRKVHSLHIEALQRTEGAESEIERYILPCVVMEEIISATETPAGPEEGTGTGKNGRQAHGHRIRVRCLCGNPLHDQVLWKNSLQIRDAAQRRPVAPMADPEGIRVCMPLLAFMPNREDTFGYANLPDLGAFVVAVLQKRFFTPQLRKHCARVARGGGIQRTSHGSLKGRGAVSFPPKRTSAVEEVTDGLCCGIIQEAIPCLKRAKRTNRGTFFCDADAMTKQEAEACINVLHGTLLHLYPRGAKKPIFRARVKIVQRLRKVMAMAPEDVAAFIFDHPSIFKLAFMEYLVNFFADFMPCETALLSSAGPRAEIYDNICVAMCDNFRQETVLTGAEPWADMNAVAASSIERITRVCKFKLTRIDEPTFKVTVPNEQFSATALHMRGVHGDMWSLRTLHPNRPQGDYTFAQKLQRNIKVSPLPESVYRMQLEALMDLHSACFRKMAMVHNYHFCVLCALNDRASKTKLRMCSVTGDLLCTTCPPGTVVSVNMLGVLLTVCSSSYYMCPCCTALCSWKGDGSDLCTPLFMQSDTLAVRRAIVASDSHFQQQQPPCSCLLPPTSEAALARILETKQFDHEGQARVSHKTMGNCVMCESKHVGKSLVVVPDLKRRVMVHAHFCSKHMLPDHILRTVHDTNDLKRCAREHLANMRKRGGVVH